MVDAFLSEASRCHFRLIPAREQNMINFDSRFLSRSESYLKGYVYITNIQDMGTQYLWNKVKLLFTIICVFSRELTKNPVPVLNKRAIKVTAARSFMRQKVTSTFSTYYM